jgi:hypothetical protein
MQFDLFEKDDVKLLYSEFLKVKTSSDNVRRGIFARHNELAKLYVAQQERIERLEALLHVKNATLELHEATG